MIVPANIAPFITAAAGIAGVAVGLLGDIGRRYWQRPRLVLLPFRDDQGDGVTFDHLDEHNTQSAWVRLGIENRGREAAKDVEVCIETVTPLEPTDPKRASFQKQPGLLIGRRLKWADRTDPTIHIPRGSIRRIDIAHILTSEPTYTDADGLAVPIRFTVDHGPSRIHRQAVAGLKYLVQVSLSASNCAAVRYDVRIEFGGRWLGHDSVALNVPGSLRIVQVSPVRGY